MRRDGEIREAELELPRGPLGGGTLAVLARVAPLGSTLVLLLVEDRTEERRVDAVRRDFVANVSHELKTPVGAISLLAEALLDAADDPEAVRRFAGRMQTEAGRLSELVQDVIDLSRLQGHDPLRDARAGASRRRRDRGGGPVSARRRGEVHRDRRRRARRACWCAVTRTQLVMALGNLIDNAVRHSPADTRGLRRPYDGWTPDRRDWPRSASPTKGRASRRTTWSASSSASTASTRPGPGTPAAPDSGSSIVKHVALGHGGEVTVWSAEGAGSTFTLRLPIATVTPEENA